MKAVILAGGEGTRMRPLTNDIPKPMLPLKGKPILEHVLERLKKHGIRDIIITTGYMGEKIREHFKDGSSFGLKISYIQEDEPLGTAGCLNLLREELKETFLLIGSDNITDLDLTDFIRFHKKKEGILSVALFEFRRKVEWGIYEINEKNEITEFSEKPTYVHKAGTMIFLIEPSIFDHIPQDIEGVLNLTDHIIPELLKEGEKVFGYPFTDYWVDIGSIGQYEELNGE